MQQTQKRQGRVLRVFKTYIERIKAFSPNARKYLLSIIIYGTAIGVYRLLFNFYILSLGYDEALVGNLVTTPVITSLVTAFPMGYLADLIGRKTSLIIGYLVTGLSDSTDGACFLRCPMFIIMNILMGASQGLVAVTSGPIPDGEQWRKRTHLPLQF